MASLDRILAGMQAQIAEMQRRQANMVRQGRVVDVDPGAARVKVDIGDEAHPLITPWIPWPERAGARKTWNPPSVGEVMTVMSPNGEIDARSLAVHGGFTDDNPPPSGSGDATVYTLGPVKINIAGGGITASVGGVTVAVSGGGLAITSGEVTHNGTNIGDTHVHGGILPGAAKTQAPE